VRSFTSVKAKCPRCGRIFTVRRLYTDDPNKIIRKFCAYCKDYFVKYGLWDMPEEYTLNLPRGVYLE